MIAFQIKRLALLSLLLASPAWAQPPEVLQPEGTIELGIGESKTLRFQEPFATVGTATEGTARIVPQSDKTFTVTGLTQGQTAMSVQDAQGRMIYTATIAVAPEPGRMVKHYGRNIKDFVGYYCSETGCGRADLDKKLANGGRDPDDPVSTTVTQPLPGGGAVTRHYQQN